MGESKSARTVCLMLHRLRAYHSPADITGTTARTLADRRRAIGAGNNKRSESRARSRRRRSSSSGGSGLTLPSGAGGRSDVKPQGSHSRWVTIWPPARRITKRIARPHSGQWTWSLAIARSSSGAWSSDPGKACGSWFLARSVPRQHRT